MKEMKGSGDGSQETEDGSIWTSDSRLRTPNFGLK